MRCKLTCGDQPCPRHLRAQASYDPKTETARLPGHERHCAVVTVEYDSDAEECETTCERAVAAGESRRLPTWAIILIALACAGAVVACVLIGVYLCDNGDVVQPTRPHRETAELLLLRREVEYKSLLTDLFPSIDHATANAINGIRFGV
jgi:hypothetical protein